MKKVIVILTILLFFGSSLLINDNMNILFLLDRSDPEILEITKTKPDLLDEVKKKIEDLIYSLTKGDITHGLNDLSPMPEDTFNCEDSGCTHTEPCSVHNYKEGQQTHRLWQDIENGEHKYLMDWQYDGWTVDDAISSHYTDYSKFSDRTTKYQDKEYLFQWKINNYNYIPEGGRQRFTFEYRNSSYTPGSIKFDENTRNGSFVKATDGTEWLDLGPNGAFEAQDGRIKCAFAPMVTAGQAALQNLVSAKGWFHRGDVWYGSENSFRGLHLWQNHEVDCPKGSYIDVVFKNNLTGKEVVIPFVFSDAKNIHAFDSAGQRIDQRYGQCRATINKSGTNGSTEKDIYHYSCKVEKVADDLNDYIKKYGSADNFSIYTYAQMTQYFKNSDINSFYNGQHISNIEDPEHIKDRLLLLNDNSIGKFTNWNSEKQREVILNYSDDDQVIYTAHTALELIKIAYTPEIKATGQDMNNYICQVLLDGFYFEGQANRTIPNWSLKCMRVYTGKVATTGSNEFTEKSKSMPTTSSIDNNRIVDFCSSECKCNICIKVAK